MIIFQQGRLWLKSLHKFEMIYLGGSMKNFIKILGNEKTYFLLQISLLSVHSTAKLLLIIILACQSTPSQAGGFNYFIKITKVESYPKSHTIYFEETPYHGYPYENHSYKMHIKEGIFGDCQTITWTVGKFHTGFFAPILNFFQSLFGANTPKQLQQNVDYLANHKDSIYAIHDIEAFHYIDKCHLKSQRFELSDSNYNGIDKSINPKLRE